MMDGNYHSWSKEFIKKNASGHWLIPDSSPLSLTVAKYGVLSGTNVESLLYQGFGERAGIVNIQTQKDQLQEQDELTADTTMLLLMVLMIE